MKFEFMLMILFFMFMMGFMSLIFKQSHLMLMLLSIEMMVLSGYWIVLKMLSVMGYELYFSLIYMTLGVCEGALGLVLMVMLVRMYGDDYMMKYNLSLC